MKKWEIITPVIEYNDLNELKEPFNNLILSSKKASNQAYAPYSKFKVGASVLLENGQIISGNNQENAAYPSTLCAERVALFYANANFPDQAVKAIAIVAQNENGFLQQPVTPCGSCRQVLLEAEERYKSNIKTFLVSKTTILEISKIKDLLPLSFESKQLK